MTLSREVLLPYSIASDLMQGPGKQVTFKQWQFYIKHSDDIQGKPTQSRRKQFPAFKSMILAPLQTPLQYPNYKQENKSLQTASEQKLTTVSFWTLKIWCAWWLPNEDLECLFYVSRPYSP